MSLTVRLLLLASLVVAACTSAPRARPQTDVETPDNPALFYVDRTTLYRYDLLTERRATVVELPSADVAVSPSGRQYAVVKEGDPHGSGAEGFSQPVLLMGATMSREPPRELGPGRSPLWSPDGRLLAAIERSGNSMICGGAGSGAEHDGGAGAGGGAGHDGGPGAGEEGEAAQGGCALAERVAIHDAAGEAEARYALGDDRWNLMGWTERTKIVAVSVLSQDLVVGFAGAGDEDPFKLYGYAPFQVWGVSPVELKLLVVDARRDDLYFAAPLTPNAATTPIDVSQALLGDGAFSPDGRAVAAVRIRGDRGIRPQTDLVLIDVATGKVTPVPGSRGALGQVVWTQTSGGFAYARADDDDASNLQAMLCTAALDCRPLFSWEQGVRLLALAE